MIYWLLIAILAYLFFSLSSFGDKFVLDGSPNPKSYTFYIGFLNIFAILFIPFINFSWPSFNVLPWIILEAVVNILALYSLFYAVEKFEVSSVMSAVGSLQPIFIFVLTFIFWGLQPISKVEILAFALLIFGGYLISLEKNAKITRKHFKIVLLPAILFSFDYIFSKFVFLNQPFLQGLIWMRIFSFIFILTFLFSKTARKEIFRKKNFTNKKIKIVFFFGQIFGALATILQSFAISLAPIVFLPLVNALRGIQYVFLFVITLFLSLFYPKILKERISKQILVKKITAMIVIVFGLAILAF